MNFFKKNIFGFVLVFILLVSAVAITGGTYGDGKKQFWPVESNGAVPVNIQDQHSQILDLNFIKQEEITSLAVQTNVDDMAITVTDSTGFADGNTVAIFAMDGSFYFGVQVGAPSGNILTLDRPLDSVFATTSNVISAIHHMNVDGSVTPQVFQIGPVGSGTSTDVDITRILGYIEDATSMDDAKFGGIPSLTNGITLRVNDGYTQNIWNVKSNGEIALLCFDASYSEKAPAGFYGFRFRNTFAGQSKHGVTVRLNPGHKLEAIVSDDLTGLTDFRLMAQGHIVTN